MVASPIFPALLQSVWNLNENERRIIHVVLPVGSTVEDCAPLLNQLFGSSDFSNWPPILCCDGSVEVRREPVRSVVHDWTEIVLPAPGGVPMMCIPEELLAWPLSHAQRQTLSGPRHEAAWSAALHLTRK